MELPKFILGDNTTVKDTVYVIHTEFPRFILNVANDDLMWFEEFSNEDEKEIEEITEKLVQEALTFYDAEVAEYDS
ncbi:MAG: hypothetical protein CMC18_04470 [Flavobacteriaceae bacterium]|nr:hypothetical protein [Flavobacteriaceae bacterium]